MFPVCVVSLFIVNCLFACILCVCDCVCAVVHVPLSYFMVWFMFVCVL